MREGPGSTATSLSLWIEPLQSRVATRHSGQINRELTRLSSAHFALQEGAAEHCGPWDVADVYVYCTWQSVTGRRTRVQLMSRHHPSNVFIFIHEMNTQKKKKRKTLLKQCFTKSKSCQVSLFLLWVPFLACTSWLKMWPKTALYFGFVDSLFWNPCLLFLTLSATAVTIVDSWSCYLLIIIGAWKGSSLSESATSGNQRPCLLSCSWSQFKANGL